MKVIIKEKEYQYQPDYPDGWLLSSGDHFKYPVTIGNYSCFIKRFEKKNPFSISGWNLMVKLKNIYEHNLVRIYDITSVEEKSRRVYYVIYEYLKGNTLDNLISRNVPVNLTRLTNDLFSALASLQFHEHWFADFVEKNFFLEDSGRFVLMDLDSTQPFTKHPEDDMNGSKDYWSLVLAFYKDILKYHDLKLSDLPGISLNQLQAIFIILRLRAAFNVKHQNYRYTEVFSELPAKLDKIDPLVRDVFIKIYNERKDPHYSERALEIKELIIQKIIHYEPESPVYASPVILDFMADHYTVENGGTFSLMWKVDNVSAVELYKNGAFDTRFTANETHVTKTAFYDGGLKATSYKLVAYKDGKQVQSNPVEIIIKDKAVTVVPPPTPPTPPTPPPPPPPPSIPTVKLPANSTRKSIDYYLQRIAIALGGLLIVALLIRWWPHPVSKDPVISGISPKYLLSKEQTVTIYGKNLPADKANIKVLLNNVPALIQSQSQDSLTVSYPETGDQSLWRGSVKIGVIVNNDTMYSPENVYVLKNITRSETSRANDSDMITIPAEESDPATMAAKEKRRRDSIALMEFLTNQKKKLQKNN